MSRFFISYSRSDASRLAVKLLTDIQSLNPSYQVFLDKNKIKVGADFEREIKNQIEKCDYFILIISEGALTSEWVKKEIGYARSSELETGKKKLFIIKYPDIPYPDFVPKNMQFLELTDNWAVDFHRLMSGVESNHSFYYIKEKKVTKKKDYDIQLNLDYEDVIFKGLVNSVEYRFDHEFNQPELKFKKVLLKDNPRDNFKISFWTNQTVTVFIVIYLNNTKQVNIIHTVEIGN